MYWNEMVHSFFNALKGLTLTWDVLKSGIGSKLWIYNWININMRCIEIKFNGPIETQQDWLTLTWDVLKCLLDMLVTSSWLAININMRCIEIWKQKRRYSNHHRLTLTWDVLKFRWSHRQSTWNEININMRCIEIKRTYLSYILLLD